MSAIKIVGTLAAAGFFVWLIGQIEMPPTWKKIFYGVAILLLVLWLLDAMNIFHTGVKLW
jgi:hypothetical protein